MHIKKRLSRQKVRRICEDYAFLAPQLFLYFALTIIPFFAGIPTLLTNRLTFLQTNVEWVGLDNFAYIFTNPNIRADFWPALLRTARFTALNYLMVYAFGLTLALLMYEVGFSGGLYAVIYLPRMVAGLALGYLIVMLFARSTGTVNLLLLKLGLIEKAIDVKTASGTTLILPLFTGWQSAGYNMAIFLAGLLSIPKETIEAAIVDGASYVQRLWRVYFPQMLPSFIIATTFCLLGSFQVFDILVGLGGLYDNQEAKFLSILVYKYGFQLDRLALGMTLGLEVGLPLLVVGLYLQRLQRRMQYH